jgi:dCTP deaminase
MSTDFAAFQPGTLVDGDISRLTQAGKLIIEEFSPANIKQACYELRASDIFWENWSPKENKRVQVDSDVGYLLKPNRFVVAIVKEKIALPPNIVARILAKGQLVSLGILPVNTYADPGFQGRLGITLFNGSRRYLVIKPGQAIAKIEFSVLPRKVDHPYAGQHGYETEIWPIPTQHYADVDVFRASGEIGDEIFELEDRFGPEVARIARKLSYYERRVWFQIAVTVACFLILFSLYGQIPLFVSVLTGVVVNLITTLGANLVAKRQANTKGTSDRSIA